MLRAVQAGRTGYSSGRGEPKLLKALSDRYTARSGRPIGTDQFACFPGTQTALFTSMLTLAEAGDGVIVPDPLYASYEGVVRATGAEMQTVKLRPETGFHLRAEDLEAAIRPNSRVLLLNAPHNPTGAVLSAEEIAAIGAVCRKHDLWIISDEVYEELIFDGVPFASPLDDPDLAERVVCVSSISKSHAAPGFRSGWAVGSPEFINRLLPVAETMLFGNQPFIADMTAEAIEAGSAVAGRMREAYKRRADQLAAALREVNTLSCFMPEAGMFMLIDVRATGLDGEAFALRLLEERGVAVMPGASFGDEARGFIRVSLTVPDERIAEAAARIAEFARAQEGQPA
ncbi:pyridoxal phosphate-dependent aminotransferase [Pseudooceanicola sp. LIPI14-2-Ac024]|uniref:pyridoxal phosphate-dependent aminotransferase n=1 Tax=Pseudooceanicola sp. LIPI14-2-Ac024 TaxID=3344875 RepID=UPI0035D0FF15